MGDPSTEHCAIATREKKVVLFFTGGTIGMEPDSRGGIEPGSGFAQLRDHVSPCLRGAELLFVRWSDLPSPHMTPERMFALAKEVSTVLEQPEVIGAVVLHGTDVLVEAAFMAELLIDLGKPLIYTGSMRYLGELGYDGIRNLINAVRACLLPLPAGFGVTLLMSDRFFAAREVIKLHSVNIDAFAAPESGPVAFVAGERVVVANRASARQRLLPGPVLAIEPRVEIIACYIGMAGRVVEDALARGAAGIVLEGFGAGNVPPAVVAPVAAALAAGIPVVLATRCIEGGVWPIYGYAGGGADLRRHGAILAGRLSAAKAQVLLMVALGLTRDIGELRTFFETDYSD